MISRVSTYSLCILACSLLAACLDPQVSDDLGGARFVQPVGTVILDAEDDPQVRAQIEGNDNVDGEIPLLNGFAGGATTRFWDFGEVSEFAAPLFRLARRDENGDLQPLSGDQHLAIIDVIPGQSGYSPYWAVFFLEVTDLYDGELIPSFAAIDEAQRLGLIHPPELVDVTRNCPIVARDVTLQTKPDSAEPTPAYWQGTVVYYFDFGVVATEANTSVAEKIMYVLRREGEEVLVEYARGIDITGDQDLDDTNNIFSSLRDNSEYSSLVRVTTVTLDESYKGIETENGVEATSSEHLFNPEPSVAVIAFEIDEILRNIPQQKNAGGL